MSTAIHRMPFGAELTGGAVRFRLWAPGAHSVDVVLPAESASAEAVVPMPAIGEGWFEVTTDAASLGTAYRYRIDEEIDVPDPASRAWIATEDGGGASLVVDPTEFDWTDGSWRRRPWREQVVYELHVPTFTPEGTYESVRTRLRALRELGVTAIELMPLASVPKLPSWGYDGVLPYAPQNGALGSIGDLKALIVDAHAHGLAVILDVVYNHFGPEGNYLHRYAPNFFTQKHETPWGAAIDFEDRESKPVREFFIHNALYWLEEYRFDGLRFDAVHAIRDDSHPHILDELAQRVRARHPDAYLILENDDNASRYLGPGKFDAQWDDDAHHVLHVLTTGERDGYYEDYASETDALLGRVLAEGFAYQGEASRHRGGTPRGEPSAELPPSAFVVFLQNHDQIGNRAFGERLAHLASPDALRAADAVLLLSPHPPLMFMGDEWAASSPFQYFAGWEGDLARAVTEGRRREFSAFAKFADPAVRERIPDPIDPATFARSTLNWAERTRSPHREFLDWYQQLLATRHRAIDPLLAQIGDRARYAVHDRALTVTWPLDDGRSLVLVANLHAEPARDVAVPPGTSVFETHPVVDQTLAPWSVLWRLTEASR